MLRSVVFCSCLFIANFVFPHTLFATTYSVDIYASVPGCGDAQIQTGESCDGANLGGSTCESVGFDGGTLSCSSVCTLITTSCVIDTNPPSSGGGGSRDRVEIEVTDTNVVVGGLALPQMSVSLLKDGQRVATVPARGDGTFQMTITGLATGVYRMQIVGTIGLSSTVRSEVFLVRVIKNSTTKISGITLPPTLSVTQDTTTLLVSGFTFPGTAVSLTKNGIVTAMTVSDEAGLYKFVLPKQTTLNETVITVSAIHVGVPVSSSLTLPVIGVVAPQLPCQLAIDSNADCRINVVDFIFMRWQFLTNVFKKQFDLNKDDAITIADFSILAYYWTG